MRRSTAVLVSIGLIVLAGSDVAAQHRCPGGHDLEPHARSAVLDRALASIRANYVFPDVATSLEGALRARERAGEYDRVGCAGAFADSLTVHLQAASGDRHLRVAFDSDPTREVAGTGGPGTEEQARARAVGYGFERVERLAGNVGYLRLTEFSDPEGVGPMAAASMTLLAGTDALVIDLRANGGGDPDAVALITGYLLGPDPVLLSRFYYRPTGETFESRTPGEVAGPRYGPERPVYVLTSGRTFSGAEEFAYNLKHLGRATVVGEATGGAAHPGEFMPAGRGFAVFVPTGRPINAVTGTNWEGVGVEPDVTTPAGDALCSAHLLALRALLGTAAPERQAGLEHALMEADPVGCAEAGR